MIILCLPVIVDIYEYVFGDLDQLEGSDKDVKALVETLIKEGKEVPKNLFSLWN